MKNYITLSPYSLTQFPFYDIAQDHPFLIPYSPLAAFCSLVSSILSPSAASTDIAPAQPGAATTHPCVYNPGASPDQDKYV